MYRNPIPFKAPVSMSSTQLDGNVGMEVRLSGSWLLLFVVVVVGVDGVDGGGDVAMFIDYVWFIISTYTYDHICIHMRIHQEICEEETACVYKFYTFASPLSHIHHPKKPSSHDLLGTRLFVEL